MPAYHSFVPLALSFALLAPGSQAAQIEPISSTFEVASPVSAPRWGGFTYEHVEATVTSLGPQGFAVGWVTFATRLETGFTTVEWLHPDGRGSDADTPTTLIDEGGGAEDLSLACLGEGRFVSVAGITAFPDLAVVYRRFAVGEAPLDPESIPLMDNYGPPSDYAPRIASNGNGLFVLAWRRSADPYVLPAQQRARVFDAGGHPVSPEIFVTELLESRLGHTAGPVGMDSDGNFVVLWMDPGSPLHSILGRRFDRTGNPLGKRFRIGNLGAEEEWFNVAMAMAPSGEFVVVWRDSARAGRMRLSRFSADGRHKLATAELAYDGYDAAIALDSAGRVALFWINGSLPALAVLDSGLRPLGPVVFGTPTRMDETRTPTRVGVAFGDDGRILTAWIGRRGNRSRASVLGRFWRVVGKG